MIDYNLITEEAIDNKLKTADPKLRAIMGSPEFVERISEISSDYNFDVSDKENLAFHKLVGITLLGFIRPDELPEAILTFIETDKETAIAAAEEVKKLMPSIPQIQPVVVNFGAPNLTPAMTPPIPAPIFQAPQQIPVTPVSAIRTAPAPLKNPDYIPPLNPAPIPKVINYGEPNLAPIMPPPVPATTKAIPVPPVPARPAPVPVPMTPVAPPKPAPIPPPFVPPAPVVKTIPIPSIPPPFVPPIIAQPAPAPIPIISTPIAQSILAPSPVAPVAQQFSSIYVAKPTILAPAAPAPQPAPTPIPAPVPPAPLAAPISTAPTPIPSAAPFNPQTASAPLNPNPSTPAPFIIHTSEEVKSNIDINLDTRGTTRPVFYKPAPSAARPASDFGQPTVVRIDTGEAAPANKTVPPPVPRPLINQNLAAPATPVPPPAPTPAPVIPPRPPVFQPTSPLTPLANAPLRPNLGGTTPAAQTAVPININIPKPATPIRQETLRPTFSTPQTIPSSKINPENIIDLKDLPR